MKRITVDEEFGDQYWWDNATAASDLPSQLEPLFLYDDRYATVTDEEAEAIERWCETIPGWNDGSEIASHPLLFSPED